ncbi:MAG: GTP-binding protein [Candidatus Omnitrophica bacterium]|nr:GTP-binding protein [Candidatus Omnitrophota bacterium]
MKDSRLNLVITGHVDHGKSTLIGRLLYETGSLQDGLIKEIKSNLKGTGIKMKFAHIMDYFEEERAQERTIDTTQFFFNTKKKRFAIIDTPGHKEFIKNMITGSSQAQAAILIISAKEGIQEQTNRHAYILNMLGIRQVILALNKMDLVEFSQDRFEQIKFDAQDIINLLGIRLDNIIPISAQKGENILKGSNHMHWYKGLSLLQALDNIEMEKSSDKLPLRFSVQDIYKINNRKIVVGKVISGCIKIGETVTVYPQDVQTKISSVEVFEKTLKIAYAGENIGITTDDNFEFKRGQIVCKAQNPPKVKNKIKANIIWLSSEQFNLGNQLKIKRRTFEDNCNIEKIEDKIDSSSFEIIEKDSNSIAETQVAKVVICLENPMAFENFNYIEELGRFVLLKDNRVCAGGIVTDQ